jgi:hypothetical protein
MFVGMALETLGIAAIIPTVAILTQPDLAEKYPVLRPALQSLGNPSQKTLVIGGMVVLVGAYFIKTLFLALLAWRQALFAFGVRTRLAQRLFTVYLRQPYTLSSAT